MLFGLLGKWGGEWLGRWDVMEEGVVMGCCKLVGEREG